MCAFVLLCFLVRSAGTKFSSKRWSRRSDLFLTIINVYAPTSKASLPLKNQFFEDLQRSVDDVPGGDILLVLGDLNVRVGTCSEQSGDGSWRSALGSFGLGERNAAGDRLLMWCAMNQFSILNTFFQKPDYKRGTWMHPATRKYHMIDFVLMRHPQRRYCTDVSVVRSANCFTWFVPGCVWIFLAGTIELLGLQGDPLLFST